MQLSIAGLYHDAEGNADALRRVIDHSRPSCVTLEYSAAVPCGGFFDRLCGERENDYHSLFAKHGRERLESYVLLMTMGINGLESTVRCFTKERRFHDKEALESIAKEKGLPVVFADDALTHERWHAHCLAMVDRHLARGVPIKQLLTDLEIALAGGKEVPGLDVAGIARASYAGYSHPAIQEFLACAFAEGLGFVFGERDAGMAAAIERELKTRGRVLHVGGAAHGIDDQTNSMTLFSRLRHRKPDRYLIENGAVAGYTFFGDRMI